MMRTQLPIAAVMLFVAMTLCAAMLGATLLSGCEGMQESLRTAADIVERHPDLIGDEEDREVWLAGARAVRSWVSEIDTAEEIAIGQSLALRAFAGFGPPHPDERLQNYVARVGRLVAMQSERPEMPYSFAVVQSETPNALALPGGFIFISTGLLTRLNNESELAAVLAHEVCHVAQRHGLEIVARDRRMRSLFELGTAIDPDLAAYQEFIDRVYHRLTTEGYDHQYEWMADEAGARYAYYAGYHPGGLLPFLQEAQRAGRPRSFEAHRTHPDPAVRISRIRAVLSELPGYGALPRLEDRYRREVLERLR